MIVFWKERFQSIAKYGDEPDNNEQYKKLSDSVLKKPVPAELEKLIKEKMFEADGVIRNWMLRSGF